MPERRVRVPKDKVEFIESMLKTAKGPFEIKAQVLGFAAAYGSKYGKRLPLSQGHSEPIRHDVFERVKLDTLMSLLAINHTSDPKVLARSDEMEELWILIFEEFANCGLGLIEAKLKGEVKYTQPLLLLMKETQGDSDELESLVNLL